jgi:hypothetical protein
MRPVARARKVLILKKFSDVCSLLAGFSCCFSLAFIGACGSDDADSPKTGGAGGGVNASGGSGGQNAQAGSVSVTPCVDCIHVKCATYFDACKSEPDCDKLLDCVLNCAADDCKYACETSYPNGKAPRDAAVNCSATQCVSECN